MPWGADTDRHTHRYILTCCEQNDFKKPRAPGLKIICIFEQVDNSLFKNQVLIS